MVVEVWPYFSVKVQTMNVKVQTLDLQHILDWDCRALAQYAGMLSEWKGYIVNLNR